MGGTQSLEQMVSGLLANRSAWNGAPQDNRQIRQTPNSVSRKWRLLNNRGHAAPSQGALRMAHSTFPACLAAFIARCLHRVFFLDCLTVCRSSTCKQEAGDLLQRVQFFPLTPIQRDHLRRCLDLVHIDRQAGQLLGQ